MATDKTLVVTTGATHMCEALVECVLSRHFVATVTALGFTELVVQHGPDPRGLVPIWKEKLVADLADASIDADASIKIETFPWTRDLANAYLSRAHVVVSHAGVGSLVDTLRAWEGNTDTGIRQRKLIAVPNTALADNHQEQIAHAFESLRCLRVVPLVYNHLSFTHRLIDTLADNKWSSQPLPPAAGAAVANVVVNECLKIDD